MAKETLNITLELFGGICPNFILLTMKKKKVNEMSSCHSTASMSLSWPVVWTKTTYVNLSFISRTEKSAVHITSFLFIGVNVSGYTLKDTLQMCMDSTHQ